MKSKQLIAKRHRELQMMRMRYADDKRMDFGGRSEAALRPMRDGKAIR